MLHYTYFGNLILAHYSKDNFHIKESSACNKPVPRNIYNVKTPSLFSCQRKNEKEIALNNSIKIRFHQTPATRILFMMCMWFLNVASKHLQLETNKQIIMCENFPRNMCNIAAQLTTEKKKKYNNNNGSNSNRAGTGSEKNSEK